MEPFEGRTAPDTYSTWRHLSNSNFKVSFTDDSYVGEAALQVDYSTGTNSSIDIGVIQEKRPHICVGATDVSFWYHHQPSPSYASPTTNTSSPSLTVRLVLVEDSECHARGECESTPEEWEKWDHWTTTFEIVADDESNKWQEFRVPLSQLQLSNPTGNNRLDLHRIFGFLLQLTPSPGSAGRILLDQVAFIGGNDLFGAALHATDDFEQLVSTEGGWVVDSFTSEFSRDESTVIVDQQEGTMELDYLVQQAADWGGYLAHSYLAPGAAYFNVSKATYVTFQYQINEVCTDPERVHLRFILADATDCTDRCDHWGKDKNEHYYSFHYVLGDSNFNHTKQVSIPLIGSDDNYDPFRLPGWSGVFADSKLELEMLKGYSFEFSMDGQGEINSTAYGIITLSDVEVSDSYFNLSVQDNEGACVLEHNMAFNGSSPVFTKKEFVGDRCCEVCEANANCLFVLSTGRDCYLASRLDADAIGLDVPVVGDYSTQREIILDAFWMDDAAKRGDFCDLCECHSQNRTIDCRGKDLATIPKTYKKRESKGEKHFKPRSLDLRENPSLVFLGSGSLAAIADGLEELWLPKNMIHLGEYSLTDLPQLREVRFEGQENSSSTSITDGNIISMPTDYFGSVCCGIGTHINLTFPEKGITFCDATHVNVDDPPGIDSTYMEFTRFKDATILDVLFPTSSFMAEAAESAQTCAQYCSVSRECRYFSYDDRVKNAQPICQFFKDDGEGVETVCCADTDYSDEEYTKPGWISGWAPQTRHELDNATVKVEPRHIVLNPENNYSASFEVSLLSDPLRGAVYIVPSLFNTGEDLDVTIWPPKVGLYSANFTARVHIMVSNVEPGAPSRDLSIQNHIESCDVAFISCYDSSCEADLGVVAYVDIPSREVEEVAFDALSYVATILGGLAVLLVLVTAAMVQKNKSKRAISFAQIEFLRMLLAGSLLTSIGAVLVAVPPTDGTCIAAVWFVEIGYTLELVPLIVKIAALNRLMAAAAQMRRVTLKRRNLFGAVALILGFLLLFLILWSALHPPQKTAEESTSLSDDGYTTVTTGYYCSGYYSPWSIIMLAWNAILLLSASVLAFQTRKIERQDFNESQTLAFLIYSHFVFIILRIALMFLSGKVEEGTLNHVRSLLYSLDSIAAIGVYFVPKLFSKDEPQRAVQRGSVMLTNFSTGGYNGSEAAPP